MNNYFKSLVSSEYDQDPGFIRLVRIVLTISTLGMVVISIALVFTLNSAALSTPIGILIVIAFLSAFSLFLSYRNILWPGKVVLPLTLLAAITFIAIGSLGLHDSSVLGFTVVIIIASLLAGQRAIPVATFLTLLGVWVVAYADMAGINKSLIAERTGWDDITVMSIIQIVAAASLNGLMSRLNSALEASRSNEQLLEQRVAERTTALETSAEVSRRLASILDPGQLTSAVVNEVRNAYNYYYAQIYLFDDTGENLVLTAGTGEAGEAMLKRGHSLPKGRGLVGRAAESNQSILVPDTAQDSNWLPNDLLPDTKAEAAIPITIGGQVLGVLDVQDNVTNDINPSDITLLTSLANQVAVSLNNARQYQQAQSLREQYALAVESSNDGIWDWDIAKDSIYYSARWKAMLGFEEHELTRGFVEWEDRIHPEDRDYATKALEDYLAQRAPAYDVEIRLKHKDGTWRWIRDRGKALRRPDGSAYRMAGSHSDITELKYQEALTSQRANQQEAINTITQRIQATTTIEEAMQITARELGHALGMKSTQVTLEPNTKSVNPESAS